MNKERNRDFLSRLHPPYQPKETAISYRVYNRHTNRKGSRFPIASATTSSTAAKSSTSGKPYKIRKPDGNLVTTRVYFYARLKEYDQANP